MTVAPDRTVFLADTAVNIDPTPQRLAEIAIRTAAWAERMGHAPRVAFLSYTSFGQPQRGKAETIRGAIDILKQRKVTFEFDGEMSADVALDAQLMKRLYPFCRLSDAANILIMPTLQSAHIGAKLLQKLGRGTMIGPILNGLSRPAQITQMGATVSDIVTMAVLAAYSAKGK